MGLNLSKGLLLVDKPVGLTSHDVIAKLRKIFNIRRIGHAGTLDPDATGLLIVGVGNITRLLDYFQASSKRYIAEVVFGVETDTLDSSGSVVAHHDMLPLDIASLDRAIVQMHGEISQLPPKVSALKVNGKRLYEYHRESLPVEIVPRKIRIESLSYKVLDNEVIEIDVECSAGTYIRSIARDLGIALGGGAHLRNLRRVSSGSFKVSEAIPLDQINANSIMAPSEAFRDFMTVPIGPHDASRLRNGGSIALDGVTEDKVLLYESVDKGFENWNQLIGLFVKNSDDTFRSSVILSSIN